MSHAMEIYCMDCKEVHIFGECLLNAARKAEAEKVMDDFIRNTPPLPPVSFEDDGEPF